MSQRLAENKQQNQNTLQSSHSRTQIQETQNSTENQLENSVLQGEVQVS
jgi:hypothetical protein